MEREHISAENDINAIIMRTRPPNGPTKAVSIDDAEWSAETAPSRSLAVTRRGTVGLRPADSVPGLPGGAAAVDTPARNVSRQQRAGMNRRLPSLIPLRAFEAVGRTGSMRAAAAELSVSHSVISHHLHTLQEQLGVKLVKARGRGIELTPEGEMYQGEIARSFEIIAKATADLSRTTGRTLKIWCRPGLADRRLMPRLPELEARLPDLEIVLCPTLARPTLAKGEADVEVAYLDHVAPDPLMAAELLVRPRIFPIASPSFLERFPEAHTIEGFARLPLLHEDTTRHWERWLQAANIVVAGPLRGTRLWHAHLTIEAARLGHGIALSNDILVSDELAAGHLAEPVSSDVRLGGYYILTESSRWLDSAIIAVREWLHDICLISKTPERRMT